MAIFVHYDGSANLLEDVTRMVLQRDPWDHPFFSGMKKAKALQPLHEWVEDSLANAADNARSEGRTWTYGTLTAPVRVNNMCQILDKRFSVSRTYMKSPSAGVDNMYLYQKAKGLKELGLDIELALLHGSRASGTGSLARRLAGAVNFITTVATAVGSGTQMLESFFVGQLQLVWNQGGAPNEAYMGSALRRVVDTYTAGATKNVDLSDKRLVNSVKVYDSSFSLVSIVPSRIINSVSNSNMACLIVTIGSWAAAFLDEIHEVPNVAQDQDGKNGVVITELTLEARLQNHNAVITGLQAP